MAKQRWKALVERDWFALSLEGRRTLGRAAEQAAVDAGQTYRARTGAVFYRD
jgi:hypothetical protein